MTSGKTLIVLEVEEGATADEINQAYKKRALKWYTFLVRTSRTMSRILILLQSEANFPSLRLCCGGTSNLTVAEVTGCCRFLWTSW